MINQKESQQVKMGTLLLKLLSKDLKTKTKSKKQQTNNHKKKQKNKKITEK